MGRLRAFSVLVNRGKLKDGLLEFTFKLGGITMEDEEDHEHLIWSNYGFLGNPFDIRALGMFPQSGLPRIAPLLRLRPRRSVPKKPSCLNPSERSDYALEPA